MLKVSHYRARSSVFVGTVSTRDNANSNAERSVYIV
jgi:hypothetical protein